MGAPIYQGLDYPSVISVLKLRTRKRSHRVELYEQIRLIEAGALSVLNDWKNLSDDAADSR